MKVQSALIEKPEQIILTETDMPEPRADQVCIRVKASGVCGTDVHIFHGGFAPAYPVIPGHEFAGEVVAVGPECGRIRVGMRVAVEPNVPCNNCEACLSNKHHYCENMEVPGVNQPGGMADHVLVRERGVFDIGDLDFELGALMEPLSCVIHSQDRLKIRQGSRILIVGAGPIGLLHGVTIGKRGATRIDFVELDEFRRSGAESLSLGRCFDSLDAVPREYDIVIDATGVSSIQKYAVRKLVSQGQLLLFGVPKEGEEISIDHYYVFREEIELIGSFTSLKDSYKAIDFVKTFGEDVRPLVSHSITLQDFVEYIGGRKQLDKALKVMVIP